jgi:D-arabinose 5-phosphate isomerase GutQ
MVALQAFQLKLDVEIGGILHSPKVGNCFNCNRTKLIVVISKLGSVLSRHGEINVRPVIKFPSKNNGLIMMMSCSVTLVRGEQLKIGTVEVLKHKFTNEDNGIFHLGMLL